MAAGESGQRPLPRSSFDQERPPGSTITLQTIFSWNAEVTGRLRDIVGKLLAEAD